MRVLHLLNDVTDRGNGIVNTAVDLAVEQVRQGLSVAVASAGEGYEALLAESGVQHLNLDQPRKPREFLRTIQTLRGYVETFQPDVVHAHMRTGLLLAWILQRRYSFALVAHVHNVHDRESILMCLADRVIAVSQSVAHSMNRQFIPKRKIRVILNRTLGSRRVPSPSSVPPADLQHPAIVTVCGMNHRKGIAELLRAFDIVGKDFRNVHLYLVGDGPNRAEFELQASGSAVSERVHFVGYQRIPQSFMRSADVFVLASRRESFGLVLIEAREVGCAIVATDVDGIAEALDGGRAGILVHPRDEAALAAAIGGLLGSDAARQEWQRNARKGIGNFQVDQMAYETNAIYEELLAGRIEHTMTTAGQAQSTASRFRTQALQQADGQELTPKRY